MRKLCLARPGATEEFPFGEGVSVFMVERKMFALSMLGRRPLRVKPSSGTTTSAMSCGGSSESADRSGSGMPKPFCSTVDEPRPMPNSKRPSERWSSNATRSATRAG